MLEKCVTVIRIPITGADRFEREAHCDVEDLLFPWSTIHAVLKDPDFVTMQVVTLKNTYIITKESSW